MAQFHPDLHKKFIAPHLDAKPQILLPDLSSKFEAAEKWMQQYFLSSIFQGEFRGQSKAYAESLIARIQMVFAGYMTARAKSIAYTDAWKPGSPGIGRYLTMIGAWEIVFANLQVIYDLLSKFLDTSLSEDGPEDRSRIIGNRIKHVSEDIRDGKLVGPGLPLWLIPHGFETAGAMVTFEELVSQVRFLAQVADCLATPSQAREKLAALLDQPEDEPR